MYNPRYSDLAVATKADAMLALLRLGYLRVYDGVRPDTADDPVKSQVLLAELRFGQQPFTPYNGSALANAMERSARPDPPFEYTVRRATWFRALTREDEAVFDGTVGLAGCDMNLDALDVTLVDDVVVATFTYVEPKSVRS